MKKKKRIAVLVAIALAVPGVGNWDRQAADAMTADTAQSSVADITESANQAELYHKVYKENTAGHISYSLQDDTGNTLSRYTSSAAAKNKRSMALQASYGSAWNRAGNANSQSAGYRCLLGVWSIKSVGI